MRGRFAWLGAAVVLLAVGGLATVGTQDTWLDGYGIIAYGLVPLAFIPLSAGFISSARASRFVESVFTAPVRRGDWLGAKVLVLLTFAIGYYVALVPMMIVYVAHIGVPPLLHAFLWWTPGLLLASVAIGTLIGVLFIGRSVAAPVGAGMGVLLAYAGFLPLQELMVVPGERRDAHRTRHARQSRGAAQERARICRSPSATCPRPPRGRGSAWQCSSPDRSCSRCGSSFARRVSRPGKPRVGQRWTIARGDRHARCAAQRGRRHQL